MKETSKTMNYFSFIQAISLLKPVEKQKVPTTETVISTLKYQLRPYAAFALATIALKASG